MKKLEQLPKQNYDEYFRLATEGAASWKRGDVDKAEALFLQAWNCVPDPKYRWGDTKNIAIGIAEFFLKTHQAEKALAWTPNLQKVFGHETDVDVVLGWIYFAAGRREEAVKYFQQAYDEGGARSFFGERKQFLELVQKKKGKKVERDVPETMSAPPAAPSNRELNDALHEQIKLLCAEGDEHADAENFEDAVEKYETALKLLPAPVERWEAATWIYTALGDAYFLSGRFNDAAEPLRAVMFCPGALDNPFIRLRRGQVAFERGNLKVAEQELACAYMLGGEEVFSADDDKYIAFIKPKLLPPVMQK